MTDHAEPFVLRVLCTGSRTWFDPEPIRRELITIPKWYPHAAGKILLSGACPPRRAGPPGADALAERIGAELGYDVELYPADWHAPCTPECRPGHRRLTAAGDDICPYAGYRRNQKMIDTRPTIGLSCNRAGSPGTRHCTARMIAAGIPVISRIAR